MEARQQRPDKQVKHGMGQLSSAKRNHMHSQPLKEKL
jgi:hypothetical protein